MHRMVAKVPPGETLRHYCGSPFGSPNRWICGSLTLFQISQGETSHIPGALSEMPTVVFGGNK